VHINLNQDQKDMGLIFPHDMHGNPTDLPEILLLQQNFRFDSTKHGFITCYGYCLIEKDLLNHEKRGYCLPPFNDFRWYLPGSFFHTPLLSIRGSVIQEQSVQLDKYDLIK
jgi:hypothetical protein